MAVPKRRTGKARKRKRRTHKGCSMPNVPNSQKDIPQSQRSRRFFCENCNHTKDPHTICPNCGHYKGRAVVEVER